MNKNRKIIEEYILNNDKLYLDYDLIKENIKVSILKHSIVSIFIIIIVGDIQHIYIKMEYAHIHQVLRKVQVQRLKQNLLKKLQLTKILLTVVKQQKLI